MKNTLVLLLLYMCTGCSGWKTEQPDMRLVITGEKEETKIQVLTNKDTVLTQRTPVQLEIQTTTGDTQLLETGYSTIQKKQTGYICTGTATYEGATFTFTDIYQINNKELSIQRKVQVTGNADGGYATLFGLHHSSPKETLRYFAPGNIYGNTGNLPENAFGKEAGLANLLIREDRLPAPLFGIYDTKGYSVGLLNVAPDGRTSAEDGKINSPGNITDEKIRVGSLGVIAKNNQSWLGYRFPLAEDDVTYSDRTYEVGWINRVKEWTKRYHPIQEGATQQYTLSYRINQDASFSLFYKDLWRWAWNTFNPVVEKYNIDDVKKYSVNVLSEQTKNKDDFYYISNALHLKTDHQPDYKQTIMGFTGKAIETAYYLLRYSAEPGNANAELHRKQGLGLINTFTKLKINPPVGEGFEINNPWRPAGALNGHEVFLRSFTDDLKALLHAWQWEKANGTEHPEWLVWAKGFTDWLLTKQYADGGFPRTFQPGTGEIVNGAPQSSYLTIPLLALMYKITKEKNYLEAALQAGEYCWNLQKEGEFTGGTIDNPNAVDKEAGTLSLEAYLMLYEVTREIKWLNRAQAAADYVETWIYIWDVPMPDDTPQTALDWIIGKSTIGLQLISTGHSLADYYCCFDADEFSIVAYYTNDAHYQYVSDILLHNTCIMMSLPGQENTALPGFGYQEEHWSLAPIRGVSNQNLWLPWVTTSHLNGIYGLEDFEQSLTKQNK